MWQLGLISRHYSEWKKPVSKVACYRISIWHSQKDKTMVMKNSSVVARDYGLEESAAIEGIWVNNWISPYPDFDIYYTDVKIHRNIY